MGRANDQRIKAGLVGEAHAHLLAAGAEANNLPQRLVIDVLTDRKDIACSPLAIQLSARAAGAAPLTRATAAAAANILP